MNKIYRNLILIFVLATGTLFTFLCAGTLQRDFEAEADYLTEIVEQVVLNTETTRDNYNAKLMQMENVWIARGKNIEYLISNEAHLEQKEEMERLRNIAAAKDIHVYDNDGKICLSTNASLIGKKLKEEKERLQEMLDKEEDYYVHIEDAGFWEDPGFCRLMLRSSSDKFSAICIEADTTQMGLKSERSLIEKTLEEAATEYEMSIVEVGKGSGIVIGMTKNNDQRLEIYKRQTNEERLGYLEEASSKYCDFVRINGEYSIVVVKEREDSYLLAYSSIHDIITKCMGQWGRTAVLFLLALAAMVAAIRYSFQKYVLKHFVEMETKLNSILEGDYEVCLEEGNNEDINKLIRVIEKLKMGYIHKSERMDKILEVLGEDIAVFECVFGMNYYFFSDKMQHMFGMSDSEWEYYLEHKMELLHIIKRMNDKKDENKIVHFREKYLELQIHMVENELVGVIIDQTDEILRRNMLEQELIKSEEKIGTDDLTRVWNRGGFETQVKKYLAEEKQGGVLMAFDLDNFKTINDTLGHPVGDEVLKIFASCLKSMFRTEDIVGRIGGDEFVAFLTTPMKEKMAEHKAEEVQKNINEKLGEYHTRYQVGVSAGIVLVHPGENYDDIYRKADEALYDAKKGGKNRHAIYREKTQAVF